MRLQECPREPAVVEALATHGCRAALGEVLERHVLECPSCRELSSLAESIRADHANAMHEPQLPTASQVWWRARVRARLDAAHTVERPIGVAHKMTVAALVGLTASLVGAQSIGDWVTMLRSVGSHVAIDDVSGVVSAALQSEPIRLTMLAAAGCVAIVVPVAALVALSRD